MKKRFFALFLVILMLVQPIALAASPNTTLTFAGNRRGWLVRTQDAYLPDRNITDLGMDAPQHMAFGSDDLLYIADTGNRRVLVFDTRTSTVYMELFFDGFDSPRGVFVTPDNVLYVADAGAGAVFMFDARTGEHLRTHGAPTAMAFADTNFAPNRIAVDVRGNMFIIGEGVFDGIIQLSSEGEFLGFFASNIATRTFLQMLQDIFFTERQREALMDRIPPTFSSVTVDHRGVVYSTSLGTSMSLGGMGLQRHDMAGRNTIQHLIGMSHLIDLDVDQNGNIFVASTHGYILVHTNSGEFIFSFGAYATTTLDIAGWFQSLQSIAVSSEGHIWALDSARNFLQSFTPTEYALTVYSALNLFNAGLYEESAVVWADVLRHNQMSVLAHAGLGRAHLYQQRFDLAMESFYLAGHREYYSAAFWEVRNVWLMRNLTWILIGVVVLFAFMSIVRHLDKKRVIATAVGGVKSRIMNATHMKSIMFAFSVARHPIDSYYYMKRKEKGSVPGALFHFVLFFIAFMLHQTSQGFLLQMIDIVDMDFFVIIGGFFTIFILFVLCNYLVTSINDGEGGIIDIFKLVSYALFPLTITFLAATALSHVVTDNEVFLIQFGTMFGFVYTGAILWLGLQEMHNYSFGQTLKSVIITGLFMLIGVVVIFNVSILGNEVSQFFESVWREVYANVTGMY